MKCSTICLALFFSVLCQAKTFESFSLPVYNKNSETFNYPKDAKGKYVVINFWAQWCTSCIQELPELENLKKKNPEVVFLGVNAGDSVNKIKKFQQKYSFSYVILQDENRVFSKSRKIGFCSNTVAS